MTEEQIIAYVDGELGPLEALRFERAMEADPALAAAADRHRRLRARIAARFAPVADEPVPARLTEIVDRNPTVVPFATRSTPRFERGAARYAALAAALVAGLVLGQLVPGRPGGPVVERDGRLLARGGLADALDTQLASAPSAGSAYHIGVSFRAGDGRYCRTFDGAAGAGLGCRDARGWSLERFVAQAGAERGAYRQAASPAATILEAAQDMMAGEPLDAAAERRARAARWAPVAPAR